MEVPEESRFLPADVEPIEPAPVDDLPEGLVSRFWHYRVC